MPKDVNKVIDPKTTKEFRLLEKDLTKLEKEFPEQGKKILNDLGDRVKLSAIGRVNVDTGRLKSTIETRWKSKHTIEVVAGEGLPRPYAYFQEKGFTPHSFHVSKWMGSSPPQGEFVTVGRAGKGKSWRPFMRPAFENMTTGSKLNEIVDKWIGKTLDEFAKEN